MIIDEKYRKLANWIEESKKNVDECFGGIY